MIQRITLGKTGLDINRFGFGGIPIQHVDERQAVETVAHAIRRGVDFIDTSRAYTTSERRIGIALAETGKDVVLATKSMERSADGIRRDIEKSLQELRKDSIALYQCHFVRDTETYRQVTGKGGALEGLLKACEEGMIGHVGITSHSLDLLERVIDDGLFETIMVCYSFLEPKAEESVIPRALAKNMGVIAMKSFSGGAIENPRLALRYALAIPGTAIIPGVESIELFDANWNVYLGDLTLDDADQRDIEAFRNEYGKQFCRRCDYCQPCPEGIAIQFVLGIRSMIRRMGTSILETGWQKAVLEQAEKCTECGECIERCPYELPIPELIKSNLEWARKVARGDS